MRARDDAERAGHDHESFFFSSRRRHTRLQGDWSSDVCSSDLAALQSAVNVGILMAVLANLIMAGQPPRYLFLLGVLPALLVLWIRKAVPEPDEDRKSVV